ncbi:MAG: response regulator transcription factor [Vicinamibacteria bacterium]
MTTAPDPSTRLAVCVVEHNPLAALFLEQILSCDPALEIFSRDRLLDNRTAPRRALHVFIVDLGALPSPLDKLLRFLRLRFHRAKIVLLGDPQPDEELCRLLFLGIQGFLPYAEVEGNLVAAVRAVAEDRYWLPTRVLEQYQTTSSRLARSKSDREILSFRERRIVELVKRRLSNREIASILTISESTVSTYLVRIFAKLGVRDRQAMVEVAAARSQPEPLPQKPK